jgi:hypothetical protein
MCLANILLPQRSLWSKDRQSIALVPLAGKLPAPAQKAYKLSHTPDRSPECAVAGLDFCRRLSVRTEVISIDRKQERAVPGKETLPAIAERRTLQRVMLRALRRESPFQAREARPFPTAPYRPTPMGWPLGLLGRRCNIGLLDRL